MGGLNGHAVPEIEDDAARLEPDDLPDGDVDALAARATRLTVEIMDLAAEALRVRDQHATMLDGLRVEVLALRREVDQLAVGPAPVEWSIVQDGEAAFHLTSTGSVVSTAAGRGVVVSVEAAADDARWLLIEWATPGRTRGYVALQDFVSGRAALVIGPRPRP